MHHSDWQPIETAPKNPAGVAVGPWILIFSGRHIYQVRWVANEYGGKWRTEGGCSEYGLYWMPLPEPPTKDKD